jgi:hypothetical protein
MSWFGGLQTGMSDINNNISNVADQGKAVKGINRQVRRGLGCAEKNCLYGVSQYRASPCFSWLAWATDSARYLVAIVLAARITVRCLGTPLQTQIPQLCFEAGRAGTVAGKLELKIPYLGGYSMELGK